MKLLRQKPYECFPTVLAMLTDRTVTSVKRELLGKELAGESWAYLISNSHTAKFAKLQVRVDSFLRKHLPWLSEETLRTVNCPLHLDPLRVDLPSGRGVLVVNRHIVVFHNGVIYDPNKSTPIAWSEYRKQLLAKNKSINLIEREG